MRYDKEIVLIHETPGRYNEATGNYEDGITTESNVWANVSPMTDEHMTFLYGKLKQHTLVVRLQHYSGIPISRMEVDGRKYQIDRIKTHRNDQVFFVSGV